jgi:cell division septum initiation protein DivIVA
MEDVLERMLAVDQQGEALVKQAESEALRIREESSRSLAESSSAASRALAEECAALEAGILESAQKERAAALAKSEAELPQRGAVFSKELEKYRHTLLKELLAL